MKLFAPQHYQVSAVKPQHKLWGRYQKNAARYKAMAKYWIGTMRVNRTNNVTKSTLRVNPHAGEKMVSSNGTAFTIPHVYFWTRYNVRSFGWIVFIWMTILRLDQINKHTIFIWCLCSLTLTRCSFLSRRWIFNKNRFFDGVEEKLWFCRYQ